MILKTKLHTLEAISFSTIHKGLRLVTIRNLKMCGNSLRGGLLQL